MMLKYAKDRLEILQWVRDGDFNSIASMGDRLKDFEQLAVGGVNLPCIFIASDEVVPVALRNHPENP